MMHSRYNAIREILDNYKAQLPDPDPDWPDEVGRAVSFIHEHIFDEQLSVTSMKVKCRIYRKSFSGKFRMYLDRYPKEYIVHHRIAAGKSLLIDAKAELTEVALGIGFNSYSAFCKTFKRKTGYKPSEWKTRKTNK